VRFFPHHRGSENPGGYSRKCRNGKGRIVADETDNLINAFDRDDWRARWLEYRGSVKWQRLKKQALKRSHHCDHCGGRRGLELHHIHYPEDPARDCLENVIILCRKCHLKEGGFVNGR